MKKILLVLINFSFLYCAIAQTPAKCLTCKDGAHDGMIDQALAHSSAANLPTGGHFGNGNSTFGQSYIVQNLCGFNYVMNGLQTTTRYTTPGTGFPATVPIAGIPAGFVVQKAYVYYGVSYTEAAAPPTSVVITNPALANSTIASIIAGTGHSVCWGEVGTATYRCDVTSMISGNGNYIINITGFANAAYEVDGVTLVITYIDPAATYSGNMVIWDGDMANFTGTSMTYTGNGFTACTASSSGSTFGLFGDMQNNLTPNVNTENFNNSIATFPNNFWNTNIWPTSIAACQTSAVFTGYTNNSNDCWLWSMLGLYWQYTTCNACSAMTVTSVDVNPSCGVNNGSITVNVVGGTAPYTYTWTPNVSTTASATGLSAGNYQITVQDAACNVQTLNVTLVMVNLVITDVQTNILCNGQSNGTITYTVSGGNPPYTYNWTPNISTTANATGLSAGTYTTVIEDQNGCSSTENITITAPPALTAPITTVGVSCNGKSDGSATVTAGGGTAPYTYAWAPGGGNTAIVSGLSAGTYTLTLTDNNGCSITSTAAITQPVALSVAVTGPQTLCVGVTGTLTANVTGGTAPYVYTWSAGATSAGSTAQIQPASSQTYTVNITDANGCTASGTYSIILGPALLVTAAAPTSVCAGMAATLCATASGGTGGNTFVWQPGNITGACIIVSPGSTTCYTVTALDNCGSIASATVCLNVNPLPAISFSADVYQGCSPLCIQFRNSTTVSGGVQSYFWTFGNGDTSHSVAPVYCYSNSGTYNVGLTAVSDSGCSATLNVLDMITVYSHPNVAFTYSPNPATIINPTIQFNDKSTDASALVYWWWTFGETGDTTSNLQNPTHVYQDTGTFCAQEVVMDIHGCTDTATNCFVIDPVFNLYIPDAFSPNGDGKNETFQPVGQYIKNFEMYIFDRWGNKLYHTLNIYQGWNGTVNGGSIISQEDTYVYKINVTDSQNKQHSFIGNVTIIK